MKIAAATVLAFAAAASALVLPRQQPAPFNLYRDPVNDVDGVDNSATNAVAYQTGASRTSLAFYYKAQNNTAWFTGTAIGSQFYAEGDNSQVLYLLKEEGFTPEYALMVGNYKDIVDASGNAYPTVDMDAFSAVDGHLAVNGTWENVWWSCEVAENGILSLFYDNSVPAGQRPAGCTQHSLAIHTVGASK